MGILELDHCPGLAGVGDLRHSERELDWCSARSRLPIVSPHVDGHPGSRGSPALAVLLGAGESANGEKTRGEVFKLTRYQAPAQVDKQAGLSQPAEDEAGARLRRSPERDDLRRGFELLLLRNRSGGTGIASA
jgi:hypothetical protein